MRPRTYPSGNRYWLDPGKGGEFHRLDGPAVEWADGSKEWWVEGKAIRMSGPYVQGRHHERQAVELA